MSVDYRLLPHFADSRRLHADARRALPERWRSDPRPEAQLYNEVWVGIVARARAHIEQITCSAERYCPAGYRPSP